MGVPTVLKMACTSQEEELRQGRMGEPWSSSSIPEQEWQDIAGHIDTTGNAPGQGGSLGTAHIWTVPTPLPRVLNSHYLHFLLNKTDGRCAILPETAAESTGCSAGD